MNNGGDAAEQIVRLSLEGFEVAAKLTGSAAKNVALLLVSVLKQEQQTKGKARLTNMIRSGKELKVYRAGKTLRRTVLPAAGQKHKGGRCTGGYYRPCRGRFQNPADLRPL